MNTTTDRTPGVAPTVIASSDARTRVEMTVLMTPDMANFGGNVHGGNILKLLDQVAYACASRFAGFYTVTLSVDQVMFKEPIMVGELVTFLASVNFTGRSSMEVGVRVVAEDITRQTRRHTNSCYLTMVAVDEQGDPTPVPTLKPDSEESIERWRSAELRKKVRSRLGAMYEEIREEVQPGDSE